MEAFLRATAVNGPHNSCLYSFDSPQSRDLHHSSGEAVCPGGRGTACSSPVSLCLNRHQSHFADEKTASKWKLQFLNPKPLTATQMPHSHKCKGTILVNAVIVKPEREIDKTACWGGRLTLPIGGHGGFPSGSGRKESTCQCRRHNFHP